METPTPTSAAEQKKAFLLERIIEASARNAFLVVILMVFGIAGGIWALTRTPLAHRIQRAHVRATRS